MQPPLIAATSRTGVRHLVAQPMLHDQPGLTLCGRNAARFTLGADASKANCKSCQRHPEAAV